MVDLQRSTRWHSPSARALAYSWGRGAAELSPSSRAIVRSFGDRALKLLKRKATRRPGPRRRSGDYVDSLGVDYVGTNQAVARMRLTSDHPAANRLELGFTGTDSIGRVYDQPPFPHFGPTLDAIEKPLTAALLANAERILRS